MSLGDTFSWYTYTDDCGTNFIVKLSDSLASALGFTAAILGTGQQNFWPYHARHMRHVSAKHTDPTGVKRRRFPCPTIGSQYYKSGALISGIDSLTWQVEGTIGEHKDGRNAPVSGTG